MQPQLTREYGEDVVPVLGFENGLTSQKRPRRTAAEEEWLDELGASEESPAASPTLGEGCGTDKWVVGTPSPSKGTGHP